MSTVLLVIHQQWYHNRWRNYDCDVMVKIKRNSSGVSNRPKISRFYNTQFSCFIIFVILIFALYWAVHLFHTNIKEAWVHVCYIHACQQKSTFSLMIINHEFQKRKKTQVLIILFKIYIKEATIHWSRVEYYLYTFSRLKNISFYYEIIPLTIYNKYFLLILL